MRLFRHIKKQEIPMTSPVLMPLKKKEGSTRTDGMAFLYQNQKVSTDSANEKVVVQDMPAREVLSYTWQGDDGRKEKELAKEALTAYATEKKLVLGDFQLLGYNGPGVAKEKRTWELQATMAE